MRKVLNILGVKDTGWMDVMDVDGCEGAWYCEAVCDVLNEDKIKVFDMTFI